jgi:hypothetical protein
MKSFDKDGKLVSETSTSYTSDGKVVNVNTVYDTYSGRPRFQNISVRDTDGKVTVENIINGKLLP